MPDNANSYVTFTLQIGNNYITDLKSFYMVTPLLALSCRQKAILLTVGPCSVFPLSDIDVVDSIVEIKPEKFQMKGIMRAKFIGEVPR